MPVANPDARVGAFELEPVNLFILYGKLVIEKLNQSNKQGLDQQSQLQPPLSLTLPAVQLTMLLPSRVTYKGIYGFWNGL